MLPTMLFVVLDQFDAAFQSSYNASGTTISLLVGVLANTYTVARVGIEECVWKSKVLSP